MNDWQPTMNLRFVKRRDDLFTKKAKRILQQQWRRSTHLGADEWAHEYEWRDVPIEMEE